MQREATSPHSLPNKTATWVPEFAVEDLSLGRTVVLVPEFAMKDLPLGSKLGRRRLKNIYNSRFCSQNLRISLEHCYGGYVWILVLCKFPAFTNFSPIFLVCNFLHFVHVQNLFPQILSYLHIIFSTPLLMYTRAYMKNGRLCFLSRLLNGLKK